MEWAIEVCKETGKPVAASMCIGPMGDLHGVSAEECAVRMAKAGANVGEYISSGRSSREHFMSAFACYNLLPCYYVVTHYIVLWRSNLSCGL